MKWKIAGLAIAPFIGFVVQSDAFAVSKPSAGATAEKAANAQRNKQEEAALSAHDQAVNDAQKALDDAQATLNEVALKAQNEFEASSEYVEANRELIADQKAYDDASSPVLDKVHASSAYVAAKDQSDQSQTALADLRANGGSDDQIAAKSADAMQAGSAVHKLESAALAADATTVAAQARLTAAQQALDALKADFNKKLSKMPEYVAAKTVVDSADKRLIEAQRAKPGYIPAVITAKGKIIQVATDSFTISVVGAKNTHHNVTVNYASSTTISGVADKTIGQSVIGKTATVVGKQSSNTIAASTIIITATTAAKKA